jgi:hypothetical protein
MKMAGLPSEKAFGPDEDGISIQGVGKVQWIGSNLSSSILFLDMNLSFAPDNFNPYRTYQNPIHLYIYIPATSSHPPNCFHDLLADLDMWHTGRGYAAPTRSQMTLNAWDNVQARCRQNRQGYQLSRSSYMGLTKGCVHIQLYGNYLIN